MTTTTYLCTTTFGSFRFCANFAEASSPIVVVNGNEESVTPFQVADASHSPHRAAHMLIRYFGRSYWVGPDFNPETDDDDEYIDGLIVSVEPV